MEFRRLPQGAIVLANLAVPGCIVGKSEDLVLTNVPLGGCISDLEDAPVVDMHGAMALPAFVDMHTHLDCAQSWPRLHRAEVSREGAYKVLAQDQAHWTRNDLMRRIDFALRCAFAHGTCAMRTHFDASNPQSDVTLSVLDDIQTSWTGRIALQISSLTPLGQFDADERWGQIARRLADRGGVLGAILDPIRDLRPRLKAFLEFAASHGLPVDFHADESLIATSECLRNIAEAVIETGFEFPVTVSHACSLSAQSETRALQTLDLVAKSGVRVVSLPMACMHLQDRWPGRTPRRRGVTLVHEMHARGIPICFASDNVRDAYYPFGDLDMFEVLRDATCVAHLDHEGTDWPKSVSLTPAQACGFDLPDLLGGAPSMVIFNARNWSELFARPQSDRIVVNRGHAITRRVPQFHELDDLMGRQ